MQIISGAKKLEGRNGSTVSCFLVDVSFATLMDLGFDVSQLRAAIANRVGVSRRVGAQAIEQNQRGCVSPDRGDGQRDFRDWAIQPRRIDRDNRSGHDTS